MFRARTGLDEAATALHCNDRSTQEASPMLLYTHPLSANAHKVKLMLGFLDLSHEERVIDVGAGEQKGEAFRAITLLGQVPVLDDGAVRIRDSQAILIYVGGRYGGGAWWPTDPVEQGLVAQWLAFSALEIQNGINRSRLHFRLGAQCDLPAAQAQGERTLAWLEEQLADGRAWLELGRPTIADCACAPFVARATEGGHDLTGYPRITAWLERVRALPGFAGMEGWE